MELEEVKKMLVNRLRNRLLDVDPALNILTEELEFTDDRLLNYIEEARYEINEEAPVTYFGLHEFPNTSLLLQGATVFVLKARAVLHLRNQITYNDAGLSVGIEDKAMYYQQMAAAEETKYQTMLRTFKSTQIPSFVGIDSPLGWY